MAETARRPDLNLLKGVMTKWISALNERHMRIVTISLQQTMVVDGSLLPTASYSPSEEGRCSATVLFNSKTKFSPSFVLGWGGARSSLLPLIASPSCTARELT